MINEYIEKVVVPEATGGRKGKDRKQQVDVYFNYRQLSSAMKSGHRKMT